MNFLLCEKCHDVFKIDTDLRTCKCGLVRGKFFKDSLTSVSNGKGYLIEFDYSSLVLSLFDIRLKKELSHFKAWVRQNYDYENENIIVDENL